MKVSLAGPQNISLVEGGLRTQITETARHLPTFGIEVDFFDSWTSYDRQNIDLFHLFAANASTYHLATTLRDYGYPFVISPVMYSNHNPQFIKLSRVLERWSKNVVSGIWTDYAIIGRICSMSSAVLPNTRDEAVLVKKGFDVDRSKINVVPNGVEERFLDATPDAFMDRYGLRDFVLYVGSIGAKRKNVLRLIKAVSDLDRPVVFIGKTFDNEYGRKCEKAIAKQSHLHLIDPIPHASPLLASAYAASDVLVLPSYYETPGISAMEAALAGSAVAITKFGGTREYFNDMAHYLDPKSEKSIRQAIRQALDQQTNRNLREHIQQNYLWPRIAQKTARLYHQLV